MYSKEYNLTAFNHHKQGYSLGGSGDLVRAWRNKKPDGNDCRSIFGFGFEGLGWFGFQGLGVRNGKAHGNYRAM